MRCSDGVSALGLVNIPLATHVYSAKRNVFSFRGAFGGR